MREWVPTYTPLEDIETVMGLAAIGQRRPPAAGLKNYIPLAPRGPDVPLTPILRPTDMASPEWLNATKPVNELETVMGLMQTVDYYTGAPVRAALGSALEPGDNPLSAIKAGLSQYGKHPDTAPTGKQIAGQMGLSDQPMAPGRFIPGDPITEGISKFMGNVSPAGIAGLGIEAAADLSPLAAMTLPGGRMFHGSPHKFDKFSLDKIGTGEGAQAFGHGIYVTDSPEVAEEYAHKLSRDWRIEEELNWKKQQKKKLEEGLKVFKNEPKFYAEEIARNKKELAQLDIDIKHWEGLAQKAEPLHYTTEIPKGEYLMWDKPVNYADAQRIVNQIEKEGIKGWDLTAENLVDEHANGGSIYNLLSYNMANRKIGEPSNDKLASKLLNRAGFTGIQYPAGTLSGVKGSDSFNYVIFNDKDLSVKEIKNLSTGQVEKLGKADPLIQEARKYKTAEEFVKAQQPEKITLTSAKQKSDYMGGHEAPMAEDINAPIWDLTGKFTGNKLYPDEIYSYDATRLYSSGFDYDNQAMSILQSVRNKPNRRVTIYRAVPKDVKGEINPGDWITITREYAKEHGESNLGGKFKIIKKEVFARDIFTDANSIQEFGYDPQTKLLPKDTPYELLSKAYKEGKSDIHSQYQSQLTDIWKKALGK